MWFWMQASIREDQAIKNKETTIPANRQERITAPVRAQKRGPVLARRNIQAALECAAKYLRRSEAARNRNFLKTHRCRFHLTARSFKADPLYTLLASYPPPAETGEQSSGTYSCTLGETFDGEIALDVSPRGWQR
jgi:hypothetical protein